MEMAFINNVLMNDDSFLEEYYIKPDPRVLFYWSQLFTILTQFALLKQVSHVSEREVLNQQAYMLFYVRDRKSIVPRKPVDIAKKENMKTNLNVNRESSTSNHVLQEYPNGTIENKAEKDALVLQKHNVILAESLMQSKRHGSELSSKAQAQNDSPDGLSVAKSELGCLSSLGSLWKRL